MRLGIIEGPLVSVLHSSANKYISQRCGGEPHLCQQPGRPRGQLLLEMMGGERAARGKVGSWAAVHFLSGSCWSRGSLLFVICIL